ncbi:MAG: hypothetical protein ILP10_01370 [Lachnospiraceae bacterium]|nr:hypothetical protein [Lachnospiraceae bacterium]
MKKRHPVIKVLRKIVRFVTPKRETIWLTPYDGEPCIFVCNHARAGGPLAMCIHFPLVEKTHPWIIAPMLRAREVPDYVRGDFWWQPGKWYTKILDHTLPYPIALILPPILRGTEPVPVYHDMRIISTFKKSIEVLKDGDSLVIFPEKPEGFGDYGKQLNTGFLFIAQNYYNKTGKSLKFYPTYIDEDKLTTTIYEPIAYDPNRTLEAQTDSIIDAISKTIVR